MRIQTISLIMCAALAACNSKSPEPTATPTQSASPAVATPAPAPAAPVAAAKPAPEGLPSRVAREVIAAGGQKCDGVTKAERNTQDGSIVASCTGGESYRIYTIDGQGAVATKL
jgi:hypothetical protein